MLKPRLLQGEKIRLSAIGEADLPKLQEWHSEEEHLRQGAPYPAVPFRADQVRRWFLTEEEQPMRVLFGARALEDDRLVGYVSLKVLLWHHRVAELGIGMGETGKGFGGEALRLVLRHAFDELNLHRVQLGVFSYNTRAHALYLRTGFVEEGRHREFLRRDGLWHDDIRMGILEREWRARSGS